MELKLICDALVPFLLITVYSTDGQMLYHNNQNVENENAAETKLLITRLRQNEIERDKLSDTVMSLQNDIAIMKTGSLQQENPGNANMEDEVSLLKRDVQSIKMKFESLRCIVPGLDVPNTADYIGGRSGGEAFNDCSAWKGRNITAIRLGCSTVFLFYIQIKYGDTWAAQHGLKNGCDPSSLYGVSKIQNVTYILDPTEYVTSISGTSHTRRTYMQSITFRTNKRSLPRCGPEDGVKKAVSGSQLLYISGRRGCVIDGIQPHWLQ